MGQRKTPRRRINLRRKRKTTISGADKVTAEWDEKKREWKVIAEGVDRLQIDHSGLTSAKPTA